MSSKPPFLKIHLRAIAHATEMEERVLRAIIFASGTEEISITRTEGHFGNSIIIFEAGLTKTGNMRTFLQQLKDAGILKQFLNRTGQRSEEHTSELQSH